MVSLMEVAMATNSSKYAGFTHSHAQVYEAIPEAVVKQSLVLTDNLDKRIRRLPKASMVYFVISMAFHSDKPYSEIYRTLCESQKLQFGILHTVDSPATSSIVEARQRLG